MKLNINKVLCIHGVQNDRLEGCTCIKETEHRPVNRLNSPKKQDLASLNTTLIVMQYIVVYIVHTKGQAHGKWQLSTNLSTKWN